MKGWLARSTAYTVRRGRSSAVGCWSRWFPRSGVVAESRFQGPNEPYPGHWRTAPTPWPDRLSGDPEARQHLRDGLAILPQLWLAVLKARDIDRRPAEEVAEQFSLTLSQEQQILAQARATLRNQLAVLVARRSGR